MSRESIDPLWEVLFEGTWLGNPAIATTLDFIVQQGTEALALVYKCYNEYQYIQWKHWILEQRTDIMVVIFCTSKLAIQTADWFSHTKDPTTGELGPPIPFLQSSPPKGKNNTINRTPISLWFGGSTCYGTPTGGWLPFGFPLKPSQRSDPFEPDPLTGDTGFPLLTVAIHRWFPLKRSRHFMRFQKREWRNSRTAVPYFETDPFGSGSKPRTPS